MILSRLAENRIEGSGASHSLLVTALLLALLRGRGAFLLQVYDELLVVLFWVPFEASEDGVVQLVVGLEASAVHSGKLNKDNSVLDGNTDEADRIELRSADKWTYLLLELLVDGV
jgi:hypothetical protein